MSNHSQSFRDVFVVGNPALLTSGSSDELAIAQLGIFNYDPKTDRTAVGVPMFPANRAIQLILGTPPVPSNLLGAVADQSKVSKPIKGKNILQWTGKAAQKGQNQIIAVGYDGFDTSKTLTALCEQSKDVFVKLSGGPIDQAFHTEGRGLVRQYSLFSGCCDDCGDDCAQVAAEYMADQLVHAINTDPILSLGSATNDYYSKNYDSNRLIKAKKIVGSNPPDPSATGTEYYLEVCDNGDNVALGAVQAQYPGIKVRRHHRFESTSVYIMVLPSTDSAPADFDNAGFPFITDCPVCPSGYTLVEGMYVASVTRPDTGDATALSNLETTYNIVSPETAIRVIYQFGTSQYVVFTTDEISAATGTTDVVLQLGFSRSSCVQNSSTSIPWYVGKTWNAFDRVFTITLQDNQCGLSRLTELQAYYPSLTIVDNGAGTGTACVHQYQTTIQSFFAPPGCPNDEVKWVVPDPYNGIAWIPAPITQTNTVVGVLIEGSYVDLLTNECAYMFWKYDAEPVFIEVSQHDQDYNDKPTICVGDWPVKEIQPIKIASGVGSKVRDEEIYFKGYERKYWDINPIVRQYQDSVVTADPNLYYDQYTIEFDFNYHEFWFSEKFTDSYRVEVYFPAGTGKQFQEAINSYVASIGIDFDPVEIV